MRQDFAAFEQRGAAILVLGPDGPRAFQRYWEENQLPFIGLSDPGSRVAGTYDQEVNLLKLGRMPAMFIIDPRGLIRFVHYGDSMSDIPSNAAVLAIIDEINRGGSVA